MFDTCKHGAIVSAPRSASSASPFNGQGTNHGANGAASGKRGRDRSREEEKSAFDSHERIFEVSRRLRIWAVTNAAEGIE